MKNFQKLALGLIVGVMAIGFSAFTEIKSSTNGKLASYSFVNPSQNANPTKSDFIYRNDQDDCLTSTNVCSSLWSQSTAPAEGDHPATDAVQGTISTGNYQGN